MPVQLRSPLHSKSAYLCALTRGLILAGHAAYLFHSNFCSLSVIMGADEACMQRLLEQALEQEAENLSGEARSNLTKLCEDAIAMLSKLHSSKVGTVIEIETEQQGSGVNMEIMDSYQQVCAADARVKRLRQEVPLALAEAMQRELVACRPPSLIQETEPRLAVAGDATASAEHPTSSRTAEIEVAKDGSEDVDTLPDLEAWRQLNAVTSKIPSLMARLDQTLQRLTRIIDISEADQNRPSPRTVEKALLNRGPIRSGDDLQDDTDLAAAHTRKRLAYELGP